MTHRALHSEVQSSTTLSVSHAHALELPKHFTAIDFETASSGPESACAIGLVRVSEGRILQQAVRLIRPPSPRFQFTGIHGITWEDVKGAPTFAQVWRSLAPLLEGSQCLVAHNASFDRRVLHACCAHYGLPAPTLPFLCTVNVARQHWGIYPTKLSDVCRELDLPLNHHEALSDAVACAKILMLASGHRPTSEPALSL